MKLHAVHTVPVWRGEDGQPYVPRLDETRDDEPEVLGWANVLDMTIRGERRSLLAVESGAA